MIRPIIHLLLHILVPAAVARAFFYPQWQKAWLIMLLTMVIDLDHLLASPIYDPDRCGIGFHPLHTWPAMGVFIALTFFDKTRLVGLGLVLHIALDMSDCIWMRL
jgi:hypothetical protein